MGTIYIYTYNIYKYIYRVYIYMYIYIYICVYLKKNLHVQSDYGKLWENQMIVNGCCSSENHRTIAGECFQQAVELMTLEFMCSWTTSNNDLEVLPDTRPLTPLIQISTNPLNKLGPGLHDNSWWESRAKTIWQGKTLFWIWMGLEPITSTFYCASWRGAPALLPTHHLSHPRIIAGAATQIVD